MSVNRVVVALLLVIALILMPGLANGDGGYFYAAINTVRASHGVNTLTFGPAGLQTIAQSWVSSMAACHNANPSTQCLAHNLALPNEVAATITSQWRFLGENVGEGATEQSIEGAFEASPEHLSNMVDPHYASVGVATAVSSDGTIWVVEDFMATPGPVAIVPVPRSFTPTPRVAPVAPPVTPPIPAAPPAAPVSGVPPFTG